MNQVLDRLNWLVTVRPYLTILILVVITVVLAAGAVLRLPPPETEDTLPQGSTVAEAMHQIDELFGESGETSVVTLLFRGEALTPDGLSQMAALVNDLVSDPRVRTLLAPADPVIAPASLIQVVLEVDGFESVTQADIDSARGAPLIQPALAAMTGTDTDGTPRSPPSACATRATNASRTLNG